MDIWATLADAGVNLHGWLSAFARVLPIVLIVPAFGARALNPPARGMMAFALALVLMPALKGSIAAMRFDSVLELFVHALRGTLVAVTASVGMWVASSAGGLTDQLRGYSDMRPSILGDERASPMGFLFLLIAIVFFFARGTPSMLVVLLADPADPRPVLVTLTHDLLGGVALALAMATPLVAASLVIEVAGALVARAASPASVQGTIAPIRSLSMLAITALVLERVASWMMLRV